MFLCYWKQNSEALPAEFIDTADVYMVFHSFDCQVAKVNYNLERLSDLLNLREGVGWFCNCYPVWCHEISRIVFTIPHNDRGLSHFLQVDTAFSGSPRLSALPQLIYGLLKSPIFAKSPGSNPDMMAVTKYAWSSLPPNLLATAIYPCLIACSGPDDMVSPEKLCKAF